MTQMFAVVSMFHHPQWHVPAYSCFVWHYNRCHVFAVIIGGTSARRRLPKILYGGQMKISSIQTLLLTILFDYIRFVVVMY